MKTRLYWFALLASAAMIAQANAGGGHHGGGGGGSAFAPASAPVHGAGPSFHPAGAGNFGGGQTVYSGQRFGGRAVSPLGSARQHIVSNGNTSIGARQFAARNIDGANHPGRNRTGENRSVATAQRNNGASQIRHGNNLPAHWQNHVAARHSANWHSDWARNRDHNWHGHHCRFINGSWFVFDDGFYPWWPYWYPYDYYGYGYDPYAYGDGSGDYDSDVYRGEQVYGDNTNYRGFADSTVAAAQKRLALQGYYGAQIDGVLGQQTSTAIARFQRNHGLRVTGNLNTDTVAALGLQRVARN